MTKVMVTIRAVEGPPALDDLVERYGLGPDDIDYEYGVVEIDPQDHLYVILVTPEAAARIKPGDGWETSGPFSNPRIQPFGPPDSAGTTKCRQVQLTKLPDGRVTAENFAVFEAECPPPGPGQVLVALRRLGLNAGLAHRLGGPGTAYGPGIGIGDVPASDAVVEILQSASDDFQPGDLAVTTAAWKTVQVCDASDLRAIRSPIPSSSDGPTLEAYLTVLGHVGLTAYTGMIRIGEVQPTDTVYVSAAAGGVGSCAVQFAKAQGATVIGSAGSADKVSMITDVLGADHAVNRHDGPAVELLRNAAPEGIDLYYDNVGGEQLEAALDCLNVGGRIVLCGAVSQGAQPSGPANYRRMIYQEITMRGFAVTAHEDLRPEFESTVGEWLQQGKVQSVHTMFDGLDSIPDAFASLLAGGSKGRVIVSLA